MPDPTASEAPPPRARLVERLLAALADGTLIRIVLSSPRTTVPAVRRETARAVDLRGEIHLSVVTQEERRNLTRNLSATEAGDWLRAAMDQRFAAALLETTRADWQWRAARTPGQEERLIRHAPRRRETPSRVHDESRSTALRDSAHDWLRGLGLVDAEGKPLPSRRHKLQQLQRFAELLGHWIDDAQFSTGANLRVYDMGCGRGALTFAAWQVLHRQRGYDAQVIGVESQAALAEGAQSLSHRIAARSLSFHTGTIASSPVAACDVLLALHACNTATDEALIQGVKAGARLIVVAPCCHQELRPQLATHAELAPLLEHGLLATRFADWLTDGLRALFLEWSGYRVKVIEFVDPEHTPRNLLLAAVRDPRLTPFADDMLRQRIDRIRQQFGVQNLATDAFRLP